MKCKVSVIVPIYNTQEFLGECLDSIIGQTYKNIEVICVDDGSTDSSPKIIDSYMKRDDRIIKIEKNHTNAGDSRNCIFECFITVPLVETNFELTTIYFPLSSIQFSCAFPFRYFATSPNLRCSQVSLNPLKRIAGMSVIFVILHYLQAIF